MLNMIINQEESKLIPKFSSYHISESGRVYRTSSPKKKIKSKKKENYLKEIKLHFKKDNISSHGRVSLVDDKGKLQNLCAGLLVAITFKVIDTNSKITNKDISYRDGNRHNLHLSNLILVDKTYPNSKLKPNQIKLIKKLIKKGDSLRKISSLFSVSEMQINRIKTGENWGNGKRKVKAPVAPFIIENGPMRKYIATFESQKLNLKIKKPFIIKRNPENPTENIIQGIVKGFKLSRTHTNITRAKKSVERLNDFFFQNITK
tara:strand:+ start:1265 stop:2047 length:783 start_codon:yes stop_codon:yes gene_type:complete